MTDKKSTSANTEIGNHFFEAFDQFLEELSDLCTREIGNEEFYRFLVERLQTLTSSQHSAVWVRGPGRIWVEAVAVGDSYQNVSDRMKLVLEQSGTVSIRLTQNEFLGCKVDTASENVQLVLSLLLPSEPSQQLLRVYSDLLEAVSGIAGDHHRNQLLRSQHKQLANLEAFIQLVNNSHSSLEPRAVGYHLTNDSRHFLQADRVWLFQSPGEQLLSCSGVADVNRRSRTFKTLRQIARKVSVAKEAIVWSLVTANETQNSDRELAGYCESKSINAFYAVPVVSDESQEIVAVLVVEMFGDHDSISMMGKLNQIAGCVSSSIANSKKYSSLPFRRTFGAVDWFLSRFNAKQIVKTLAVLAIGVGLLLSMFLVHVDFYISVDGQLRPVNERHVFAPSDGIVESTSVEYGDQVKATSIVATMVSPEFQLKLKQLQASLDAARKKLETNQILRGRAKQESQDEIALGQLTAEIEQNRLEIEGINENISLYLKRTKELSILAPIDGQVISRDVSQTLLSRPVVAGNRLLTIADTDSDWQLIFEIPDREMGYLNDNVPLDSSPWQVEYRLTSNLEQPIETTIEKLDSNQTIDQSGRSFVNAYCKINKEEFDQLRVGQTVKGRVYCGRKSLFFIWTRDIRDFFRSNFFWM